MVLTRSHWIILICLAGAVGVAIGLLWPHQPVVAPTTNEDNTNQSTANTNTTTANTTLFSTVDLPDRDSHFSFSLQMPAAWAAEYVAASQAINVFDPQLTSAGSSLEKSQVFIQYYVADDWQPSAYSTKLETSTTAGQPSQSYDYQVPDTVRLSVAPGYPVWVVASHHQLLHLRIGAGAPYTFLVFHQAAAVSDATFSAMVDSLQLNPGM